MSTREGLQHLVCWVVIFCPALLFLGSSALFCAVVTALISFMVLTSTTADYLQYRKEKAKLP